MMCCLTGASQQLVNSSYLDGWPTPLKNHRVCQLALLFPIYIYTWNNKIHVPNHQPDIIRFHWWNIHDHMKKKKNLGYKWRCLKIGYPPTGCFPCIFPTSKWLVGRYTPFSDPHPSRSWEQNPVTLAACPLRYCSLRIRSFRHRC
jgi:hypothetical protein